MTELAHGPVRLPRELGRDGYVDLPVASAQRGLWPLQRFFPDSFAYNYPILLRMSGVLRVDTLHAALALLVDRHESLRTTLHLADDLVQRVAPPGTGIDLLVHPVGPGADPWEEARTAALHECRRSFDLATDPLLRAHLYRVFPTCHLLALVLHHAVFDGWSEDILLRELAAAYSAMLDGREPDLPLLQVQHADVASWERDRLAKHEQRLLDHWTRQLAGLEPVAPPPDRTRPARPRFLGAAHHEPVPAGTLQALRNLCRAHHVTRNLVLFTSTAVTIGRWAGHDDVPLAVQVATRPLPAAEHVIGFLVNGIVLRVDFRGRPTFADLLDRVVDTFLSGVDNQDLPFDRLAEHLAPERGISGSPLARVAVAVDVLTEPEGFTGLQVSHVDSYLGAAKWDLAVTFQERHDRHGGTTLTAVLTYDTDLYEAHTVERLAVALVRQLGELVTTPERPVHDVLWLTAEEEQAVVTAGNGTAVPLPGRSIAGLFEEVVTREPRATAVYRLDGPDLDYAGLNAWANRTAHRLVARGVGKETLVGICLRRSARMIAALLGVLKAGGAYVPLDPAHPPERLRMLVEDTGITLVLVDDDEPALVPGAVPWHELDADDPAGDASNPPEAATGTSLSHVLHTSGSTGTANPVAVEQRSVVRLVRNAGYHEFGPADVALQLSPLTFDASLVELWGPLLNGGAVALPPGPSGGAAFLDQIRSGLDGMPVTLLQLIAPQLNLLTEHDPDLLSSVRTLLVGGDVVSPAAVATALDHVDSDTVLHMYGPTESTLYATYEPVWVVDPHSASLPIGRPVGNTTAYVVDEALRPVPPGMPGELVLGGAGVARGYLGRPGLTADRFRPDPFSTEPGARLYRTGDQVRALPDGRLRFLGRTDGQVKVRGVRVETGEVAAALRAQPGVRDAVVGHDARLPGGGGLVGHVVMADGVPFDGDTLDRRLRGVLPGAYLPAALVAVPAIPLTRNGKVERAALPAPTSATAAGRPATTATERAVGAVWARLLRVEVAAVDVPFFSAGGNSVLLVALAERLAAEFPGRAPSVVELFEYTTVARIAAAVDERGAGEQA
jgi:amino acid adenylation domain-containing protein